MQGMFNVDITIQSVTVGADDEDGNKTYSYTNILTDERCRAYEFAVNKLTDNKNWITHKVRRFMIRDIDTDLTKAVYVVLNGNYYKIERIITTQRFSRSKHRIIETAHKEGKA